MQDSLQEIIEKAHASGKEPFDFEKFARLYHHDTGTCETLTSENTSQKQQDGYKRMYYRMYPVIMTVAEFAKMMNEADASS